MPENEKKPEEQNAKGAEAETGAENSAPEAKSGGESKPRGRGDRNERGGNDRGGGRGRGRGGRKDREPREESPYIETLIDVYRCSATVKGGRRLSFGALFTVGDGKGKVGIGYGKAKEVPAAIQKAMKKGRTELISFPIVGDGTIPHRIVGRFGASEVILIPALPGTGVIASASVKAVLEAGGLKNILTKSVGSNNTRNVVKAVINALSRLRSKEQVEKLRGVTVA